MNKSLQNRWEPFCRAGAQRAVSTLKNHNIKYKNILNSVCKLERLITEELNNQTCTLTEGQKNQIKDYFRVVHKKEEFEKTYIYGQGMCDCFSIVEKFK